MLPGCACGQARTMSSAATSCTGRGGRRALLVKPPGADGLLLLVQRGGEAWDVVRVARGAAGVTVASALPFAHQQGVAEDLVQKARAASLDHRSAPWCQAPASQKQRDLLLRQGSSVTRDVQGGSERRLERSVRAEGSGISTEAPEAAPAAA